MKLYGKTLVEILPLSDLYTTYSTHHRLTVFVNKGRKCVVCGREGWLLLEAQGRDGSKHVDLYSEDFILMTVDHIVPKAVCKQLGWTPRERESIDNKQPMCDPCNNSKGSEVISNEELQERRPTPIFRAGPEIIRQLVFNNNIFNRELA